MARPRDVAVTRALAAAVLAAIALEGFSAGLAPWLGLRKLDYVELLGTLFSTGLGFPPGKLWLISGWVYFVAGSIAWTMVYAYYVCDRLLGPGWFQGLVYGGLGVFLVSSLVFFPVLGVIHPHVRGGEAAPPGLFGMGLSGGRAVAANFLGHCVFGLIVGRLYRRRLVF